MEVACLNCGGTGEAYDFEKDDWVSPIEDCHICKGTGLIDKCKQDGGCIPNRSGYCYICGMEVVQEVDDDGEPKLD